MQVQNIDRDWRFGLGTADFYAMVRGEDKGIAVNLPHDYMIGGEVTPDAQIPLKASAEGAAYLAGFGSAAPVTAENYAAGSFSTYRGRACGILRSGYEAGEAVFTVGSAALGSASVRVAVR